MGELYTITLIGVLVMVQHMMLLDFFPDITFKVEMMNGVMRHIIKKVA